MRRTALLPLALAALVPAACQDAKDPSSLASPAPKGPEAPAVPPAAPSPTAASGAARPSVDEAAIDPSARACDDFYQYACGGWMKATPIPDDEASWTRAFNGIAERNEKTLRELLEAFARGENADQPYAKALGDFYASCMDEAGVEKAGLGPLDPELAKVNAVKDAASLSAAIGKILKTTNGVPVVIGAAPDFKDASAVITQVAQAGLGLPDRDYYLSEEPKKKELLAKYTEHVERVLAIAGDKDAKRSAKTVVRMETSLAKASMTREERRDPKKTYHRMTFAELQKLAPEIDWKKTFAEAGAPEGPPVNVAQPEFVKAFGKLARSAPAADWRTYLRWHVVGTHAMRLPATLVDEAFKFKAALTGVAKLPPRWKRCVRETDGAMGEALGQAFVKATLGAEGKTNVLGMIREIEGVMNERLDKLAWMDDPTRKRAHEKLGAIANMIAYPDKWRSYDKLVVERGQYFANGARADAFDLARELAKSGKPVDRTEWQMTPPTVNAYYDPTYNQMVFPAGILQPPFYGNERALASNFGGIGMVMGHELTHGFDDEGRQFDAKGNLSEWWSPKVNEEFLKRASCVEKQYAGYVVATGEHLNGKLTLGENIADLGGLKMAYIAMKARASSAPGGKWTADQEFFLGFAQGWCQNMREEMARLRVTIDPHSPARFRVIGPASNLPEFAAAFGCKEGDKMVRPPADRCEIW